jgi:hypothetical protein
MRFWSQLFPGVETAEDVVYHPEYALLSGLTGFVPHMQDADAFDSGYHLYNPRYNTLIR